MICAEDELGLSDDHAGIMVLSPDAVIGTPLAQHLDLDDYILGFELTPNRGDSMSAIGLARDLAALAGAKVRYPRVAYTVTSEKASDVIKIRIDDPDACPRFTARIIRNVKPADSPWWVQKKLIASGIRPISNIVDVTNLVMLETGNPVHAFDLDRFGADEIVVRRAKAGEKLTTLDGKDHVLTPEVIVVCSGERARAAGGVMGGFDSEVTDKTKNILLEVACFNPSDIRKSRRQLGLVTEASQRMEKGVDPNNVPESSARVCQLMQELCGGEVAEGVVDCYPKPIRPRTIELRPERCAKILGIDFGVDRIVGILRSLEFTVEEGAPLRVTAPTFRLDIQKEIDLIEEIARIPGYDAIPDAIENIGPLFTPLHADDLFEDEIRTTLTGGGFDEMMGHGLAHSRQAEMLNPGLSQLRIIAPVSEELDIMRNDLAQTALTTVAHNIAHRCLDMRLFEIGKVYFPPNASGEWIEEDRLMMVVSGNTDANWREKPRELDFYDITGAISRLAARFHWPSVAYAPGETEYFDKSVSFDLVVGGRKVGWIGRVDSDIARRNEIKQPVYLAQLRLAEMRALSGELTAFKPLPQFPAAPRDIAAVVDSNVRVGDMLSAVRKIAGQLAESVELFDLYEGKQIGEGKKSVGLSVVYRSAERSLSSEEVDAKQAEIVAELQRQFGAEIRDK
jgi:phenylalanyl-tRNA synthetase beta chain